MKNRKTVAVLLCLLLIIPSLALGEPITVTDMKGRVINLEKPAERIVVLSPADCEILFALGAGETLVGRDMYCDYPEAALDATVVQSGYETNIEQILALEPDVVLMPVMAQTVEQVAALENAGIAPVVSDAQSIEGVYEAIRLIGAITGNDDAAAEMVASMQAGFAEIVGQTKDEGKTVYFEVSPLQYGLWTAGANTFMDEIAAMLNLTNAFADVNGWGEISAEQVIERDPDYIITISMYFGEGPTPVEEILSRQGWQGMRAIQNEAVLNANSDEISRPGPRLLDAARTIFDFISE